MSDVTYLRLLWADGDILKGHTAGSDSQGRLVVLFESPTTGRVASTYPDDSCVYSVTCNECLMGHEAEPDPRTGEPVSLGPCRHCDGKSVVERVSDRLIGTGSVLRQTFPDGVTQMWMLVNDAEAENGWVHGDMLRVDDITATLKLRLPLMFERDNSVPMTEPDAQGASWTLVRAVPPTLEETP